VTKFTRQPVQV